MENNSITTTKELIDILGGNKQEDTISDFTKLKYVLYVRKSTDETEKQVRSLQDQIDECMDFAKQKNLNIINVIQESESAKYSGMRAKFNQILKDLENKKYDGILAWHPNRLARNMKDAGEIIDMLDRKIIKDLKFASFYFENSASGKLTLGITFALAKQYTDQLSDDITRGNQRSTLDGKSISMPKHGYRKNRNSQLEPNGENYAFIKEAFNMRIKKETLENISDYLNNCGYCRYKIINKQTREYGNVRYKFNKDTLTAVFKNPIYAGILQHGDVMVDLKTKYDFQPMISVEDFCKINNIKNNRILLNPNQKENVKARLLNGKIKCVCGKSMTAGITTKKLKSGVINNFFYYRCVNKECKNCGKSIRAIDIVEYIQNYIADCVIDEKKAYSLYLKKIEEISNNKNLEIINKIKSYSVSRGHLKISLERTKNTFNNFDSLKDDINIINTYKNDIVTITKEIEDIDKELVRLENEKEKNKIVVVTFNKFVELLRNLYNSTQKKDNLELLSKRLNEFCLNLIVDHKKILKLELKEHYNEFMKLKKDPKVLSGGRTKS